MTGLRLRLTSMIASVALLAGSHGEIGRAHV